MPTDDLCGEGDINGSLLVNGASFEIQRHAFFRMYVGLERLAVLGAAPDVVVRQGDLPVIEDIVLVLGLLEHALGEVFGLLEVCGAAGIAAWTVPGEDELGWIHVS